MNDSLLKSVRRYADQNADPAGVARTPVTGLTLIRYTSRSGLVYDISRPLVCLVLQGSKRVTMGTETFDFGAGDSLLITADVPTVSQVTSASEEAPYLSLVMDLNLPLVAELMQLMDEESISDQGPVTIVQTDREVAGAALRLMGLLKQPAAISILEAALVRELHYWLLRGRHGASIRRLGWPDSHAQRVGRAVSLIRAEFTQPLSVERLAATAGMSASSFHQHFRKVTSLSPLQFQKQLRLIEARRLMTAEGMAAASAAFAVGYESVPQFTREYGRVFGKPPATDREAIRRRVGLL